MSWTASLVLLWASCALAVPLSKPKQKVLLISFDGFRWDYDRDVDTPYLDKMAQDGVKAKYVTPAYLTVTSPAHFTLLTGKVFLGDLEEKQETSLSSVREKKKAKGKRRN